MTLYYMCCKIIFEFEKKNEFQTGFKFGLSAVVFSWDLEEHLIIAGNLTHIFIYLTLYAYVLLNSRRDFLSI